MKLMLNILIFFCYFSAFSQQIVDDNIRVLIEKYSEEIKLKCEIKIAINVEGMIIPDKIITVDFVEGERPKVKGKGLALLPKKGMINQFNELFSTPLQSIVMGEKDSKYLYKLVSLDDKSNWVTADIIFDKSTFQIYESIINTRKQGAFKAVHTYSNKSKYPSKSVITFDVKKFKIPLRFIGRNQQVDNFPDKNKNVLGTIILTYTYLD